MTLQGAIWLDAMPLNYVEYAHEHFHGSCIGGLERSRGSEESIRPSSSLEDLLIENDLDLSREDEISENINARCDLPQEKLGKRMMHHDEPDDFDTDFFSVIKKKQRNTLCKNDDTSSIFTDETQETASCKNDRQCAISPMIESKVELQHLQPTESDEERQHQNIDAPVDLDWVLTNLIHRVRIAKPGDAIDLKYLKAAYANNLGQFIPQGAWKMINQMLTNEQRLTSLQEGKYGLEQYLSKPTPMFFDYEGNVLNSYIVTGCEEMTELISLIKTTPEQRSEIVKKHKSKELAGDILHPSMRCPQLSSNGKYINSRDVSTRKHIYTGCIEVMSYRFCDFFGDIDEGIYQPIIGVIRKDIIINGRVQNPEISRIFKEAFFYHYVGRNPENYEASLKKKKPTKNDKQTQKFVKEHMAFFDTKNTMFEGCLRHLFKFSKSFYKTFIEILESDELLDHLDGKAKVQINKFIKTGKLIDCPYLRIQNQLAIIQFKIYFEI